MALNYKSFWRGIKLIVKGTSESDSVGDLEVLSADNKLHYHNGTTSSPIVTEEHSSVLENKDLVDGSTKVIDETDPTISVKIDAAGTTGTSTTILSSQTVDRVITLPDTTDTLATVTQVNAKVTGPASATNNAIPLFDGTTGKLVKDSTFTVDSASGIIQRDSGLVLYSPSGDMQFTPAPSGKSYFNNMTQFGGAIFALSTVVNTAGSNLVLTADNKSIIVLTNATSIDGIIPYDSYDGQIITLINYSPNPITLNNETGATIGARIITGAGGSITLPFGASVQLVYSTGSLFSRWTVIGGGEAKRALDAELLITNNLDAHVNASGDVHGIGPTASVVGTDTTQTLTNKTIQGASIETPSRLDAKIDTLVNLTAYASTATNGQFLFASDTKEMYQVIDGELAAVGGAPIVKLTAGETLAIGDIVYISTGTGNDSGRTAGRIYKADASNDDRIEILGLIKKAGNLGDVVEIQTGDLIKGLSGLTAGTVYFLSDSSPGVLTSTPPTANGSWAITVGLAASTTELIINPVASASANYIEDAETSFTIDNNQSVAANVTGLLFDGIVNRSFMLDYSIYRKTDTALSAVAQCGQLRGVYNTQAGVWYLSDDYAGQNSGVNFSISVGGQIQYTSTNITGTNYVGTLKYSVRRTFGV